MEINIEKEHQMEGFTTALEIGAFVLMGVLLVGASGSWYCISAHNNCKN